MSQTKTIGSVKGPNTSAGLLVYRGSPPGLEVLLVHPGGPFFRHKDDGVWTIPKGQPEPDETLQATAAREFEEEMGLPPPPPEFALGQVRQRGGKIVCAFAAAGSLPDGFEPRSNLFEMEWPPRSGRLQRFPEIDRAAYFSLDQARLKMNPAQVVFLNRLLAHLSGAGPGQLQKPL